METERLELIAATPVLIEAELEAPRRLGPLLSAVVPDDWPPEHHDRNVLSFWRQKLARPEAAGWWLHYGVLKDATRTLVASVGYKGPPTRGTVEIGYSVIPSRRRQGLATEASRALIDAAWKRGAEVVIAHTYEHLEPSIGVLRKLGFEQCPSAEPGALEFRLRSPAAGG